MIEGDKKFKGVVFDLDGTLVNSLEDLADSMNEVLSRYHYPVHEVPAYKLFIGNGMRNLVRVTLPEAERNEQTIAECYSQLTEIYNKNCLNKTKPYEGIVDLLNELKQRNLKLSVFSNKADEFVKTIIQTLLPEYFDEVAGLTTEAHRKPNPFGALKISKKFDIRPENMLYLGDTSTDMQTANNAGMYAVGVTWGFRTRKELLDNGAKFILDKPMDLMKVFLSV